MPLPPSFARDGYVALDKVPRRGKFKRLMVGTDGWSNTGKSEFALSAPGPIEWLCLDRGYESLLDNPRPPQTRRKDVAIKVLPIPLASQAGQTEYVKYWKEIFWPSYMSALENPNSRTVVLDTDSDTWELQRLAEFGKLTQVPALQYPAANAARKAMIARAFDSGKIVIATNKLEEEYESKVDSAGKTVNVKTGNAKRQGFRDWTYLWQLQLRHITNGKGEFGVRVLLCKADTSLQGLEFWNDECNFQSVVSAIYPQIPLTEWGF